MILISQTLLQIIYSIYMRIFIKKAFSYSSNYDKIFESAREEIIIILVGSLYFETQLKLLDSSAIIGRRLNNR